MSLDIDRLDPFTRQYMETALWSSNDESDEAGGDPMDENYDLSDIADETVAQMIADCRKFQEENKADLEAAYVVGKTPSDAGHDFYLTRCGHGVGFWEKGDWPEEIGERLTAAAEAFKEYNLYVGNDGKIHN